MSLSSAALSTALQDVSADTENDAIGQWVDAWATYFAGAISSNGVQFAPNPANLTLIKNDMITKMNGLATNGPSAVGVAINGWWVFMQGAPASYFAGATAISVPTGVSTIASDMETSVFVSNRLETSIAPAMDRLASFLHTKNSGGSATIGGVARTIA